MDCRAGDCFCLRSMNKKTKSEVDQLMPTQQLSEDISYTLTLA